MVHMTCQFHDLCLTIIEHCIRAKIMLFIALQRLEGGNCPQGVLYRTQKRFSLRTRSLWRTASFRYSPQVHVRNLPMNSTSILLRISEKTFSFTRA